MRCANCGADNRETAKFCDGCGAQLALKCPTCGMANRSGAKFCDSCGKALDIPSSVAFSATSATDVRLNAEDTVAEEIEGERKIVTALFADLKGSTELLETLDPEEGRAIVEPLLRIMSDAVRRYEGYLVRTTGDGVFTLFGAPVASEDHPQRALYAALQMQQELRAYTKARTAKALPVLEARVGVHTGEVVAYPGEASGKVEYRLIGHTANLAARMESIAAAGSIAVSETTAKLCEGYFELRELGPTTVKGVSTPVRVYEVLGPGPLRTHFDLSTRRGLTRFVGRERELEQMRRALEQSMAGQGQIVAMVADAGTGKSRLFYEFKTAIPATCKILEAYSVSHGKASAWLPVLELLHGYFSLADTDDPAARREKVRDALTALDSTLSDTIPYLVGLLGIIEGPDPLARMDARIKRQRTLEAIKRIVIRESLKQPVVLSLEDLHWIDEQTQALLDLLADSIASAPVLLLVNYRPEYRHDWGNKSYYHQVQLAALDREGAESMLTTLLGAAVELDSLKRLIIEQTEGNPFFIEETVQALFEDGSLVRNGVVKVTRSMSRLGLPPTVHGMLAARIDRLPQAHKELLQTLAVIGRTAPLGLLRQIAATKQAQLELSLAELQTSEFIYERSAAGDVEYVFKHALVQEVAYSSLLVERRRQLHERTGEALESVFVRQLDDHINELAHHYSKSNNVSKAVEYLGLAGRQAMQRSANAEAMSNLTTAIELLQQLPDGPERMRRELQLQLAIPPAIVPVKGWAASEIERVGLRGRELCERLGNPPEYSATVYLILWYLHWCRAASPTALELARRFLEWAENSQNPAHLLLAHHSVGVTLYIMGELPMALKHEQAALSLYDPGRPVGLAGLNEKVVTLSWIALIQWFLGYPDEASRRAHEALAVAEDLADPRTMLWAESSLSRVFLYRGDLQAAQNSAQHQISLSDQGGFVDLLPLANSVSAASLSQLRSAEQGIEAIQKSLADVRASGVRILFSTVLWFMAEACVRTGRFEEGMRAVNENLELADESESRLHEADSYRLKGELILAGNSWKIAAAQACFERAIAIARRQSARSWELRASTSLARLLMKLGHRDEGRQRLSEIYNWFTEGFDTADLKEAKALLETMNP